MRDLVGAIAGRLGLPVYSSLEMRSCVSIRLFPLFHSRHRLTTRLLLVFVTILAQSFFTLVSCHFVAFTFLSVWHSRKYIS